MAVLIGIAETTIGVVVTVGVAIIVDDIVGVVVCVNVDVAFAVGVAIIVAVAVCEYVASIVAVGFAVKQIGDEVIAGVLETVDTTSSFEHETKHCTERKIINNKSKNLIDEYLFFIKPQRFKIFPPYLHFC